MRASSPKGTTVAVIVIRCPCVVCMLPQFEADRISMHSFIPRIIFQPFSEMYPQHDAVIYMPCEAKVVNKIWWFRRLSSRISNFLLFPKRFLRMLRAKAAQCRGAEPMKGIGGRLNRGANPPVVNRQNLKNAQIKPLTKCVVIRQIVGAD